MPIRIATVDDWKRIVDIYNDAIATRISTADTEIISVESKEQWLAQHDVDHYPIYVDVRDGVVTGWCSLSPYRLGRPAFRDTAEISYYVSEQCHRNGIGHSLVSHALSDCSRLGIETLVAILLESNLASIGLLRKFGFEEWGRLPKIAEIDGNRYDHLYMGRRVST